jgi:cytoskeletal protein CcmA (bactofilin family)
VKGSVATEEFRSSGSVRIDGGLKAEEVDIDLGGTSKIPTIEAEEVRVKATGGFFRVRGELTAERIEGSEIELEATTAALVKGDEVHIGPHCRIDVVEAKELIVHQSSEVRERRVAS